MLRDLFKLLDGNQSCDPELKFLFLFYDFDAVAVLSTKNIKYAIFTKQILSTTLYFMIDDLYNSGSPPLIHLLKR